jgi:hypothetical protein
MSGFEYSRPRSTKPTSRSLNPRWDIYRWPTIQNGVPKEGTSRKRYDIYSFGLLLLEIAHWQPLHKLLCLKKWPAPSTQNCRVRGWLLNEESLPPFRGKKNPLPNSEISSAIDTGKRSCTAWWHTARVACA